MSTMRACVLQRGGVSIKTGLRVSRNLSCLPAYRLFLLSSVDPKGTWVGRWENEHAQCVLKPTTGHRTGCLMYSGTLWVMVVLGAATTVSPTWGARHLHPDGSPLKGHMSPRVWIWDDQYLVIEFGSLLLPAGPMMTAKESCQESSRWLPEHSIDWAPSVPNVPVYLCLH